MRLIDADALLTKRQNVTSYDEGGWGRDFLAVDVEDIKGAQTIEPVKHGHWVRRAESVEKLFGHETIIVADECSCCETMDNGIYAARTTFYKYCPWCGARMDEERMDEEVSE